MGTLDPTMDKVVEEIRRGFAATNNSVKTLASAVRQLTTRMEQLEKKLDSDRLMVTVSVQGREWRHETERYEAGRSADVCMPAGELAGLDLPDAPATQVDRGGTSHEASEAMCVKQERNAVHLSPNMKNRSREWLERSKRSLQVRAAPYSRSGPTGDEYAGTYLKMKGAVNLQGGRYEYKLATLLFLRGLNQTDAFQMGTNAKAAGKFDDVTFRFRSRSDGRERALLIQLKHKVDDSHVIMRDKLSRPGKKNSFYLGDYFDSYVNIEKQLKENAYFVLFTNASVQQRPSTCVKKVDVEIRDILDTGGKEGCLCTFDFNADYDIIGSFAHKDFRQVERFLQRFILCSNQLNEKQLQILIQQELIRMFKTITPEINVICREFIEKMQNWWESDNANGEISYITKEWSTWKEIQESTRCKINSLADVRFAESEVAGLGRAILDSKCAVVNVDFGDAAENLRGLKLLQALRSHGEPFIVMSETDSWENLEKALDMWVGGWCDVLVLDAAAGDQRHDTLGARLCMTLREEWGRDKLLVLTGSGDCGLVDALAEELQQHWRDDFCRHWRHLRTTCEFQQLDDKSQDNLRGKSIMFQGYNLNITSLKQNHILKDVLKGQALSNYMNSHENYVVGSTIKGNESVHIKRKLLRDVMMKKDVLRMCGPSDLFYISGITKDELKKYVTSGKSIGNLHGKNRNKIRYFIKAYKNTNSAEEFAQLLKWIRNTAVHWLDYHMGSFKWKESYGSSHNLWPFIEGSEQEVACARQQMTTYRTSIFDVREVLEGGERVVVVIGEPGMGKTVLLAHVASTIKKQSPHSCVVRVNLNEITKSLEAMLPGGVTPEAIFDILCVAAGVQVSTNPKLAEALLRGCVMSTGNAVILLDAYDEISPVYNGVVMDILEILLDCNVSQLWVTSRPIMQAELEKALGVKSFTLQNFSREQQITFLAMYWEGKGAKQENAKDAAVRLINCIYKDIPLDNDQPISSIPLHTMIIAEAYEQYALSEKVAKTITSINLFHLYKKFIEKIESIYFKEKLGIDSSRSGVSHIIINNRKKFMYYHMISALVVVLGPTELRLLHVKDVRESVRDIVGELEEGTEKTGIIVGVVNGEPRFIHKTFAEYFVALWLAEHWDKNTHVIERMSVDQRFAVVIKVFDLVLSENCPLHTAVLNDTLREEDAFPPADVDALDACRRTALHLAARKSKKSASVLLKRGADVELADGILKLTPVYHAARAHAWDTVVLLLDSGARVKRNVAEVEQVQDALRHLDSKRRINKVAHLSRTCFDIDWPIFGIFHYPYMTIMNVAAFCGNAELFAYLLNEGGTIDSYTESGKALLHCAVRGGNVDIVKSVLKCGADLNYRDMNGFTPLYLACANKDAQSVKCVLREDAGTNVRNAIGRTPLHEASLRGCTDIMQMLTDADGCATVNLHDDFGNTPLHLACKRKHKRAARMLLAKGANENSQNWKCRRPLHVSIKSGHVDIVRVMLACSAEMQVDAKDSDGNTALDIALRHKHSGVVRLLNHCPRDACDCVVCSRGNNVLCPRWLSMA